MDIFCKSKIKINDELDVHTNHFFVLAHNLCLIYT